jgi:1-acyl-sn-glycerol-3-phosphate acyltransferase
VSPASGTGAARKATPPRRDGRSGSDLVAAAPAPLVDAGDWLLRGGLSLAGALGRYHRHRVLHLERLERLFENGRRVILIGNHSLDVVDPTLLLAEVYARTGRLPHFIGHEAWFRVPVLREFARHFHVIPARRPEETVEALREHGFLMLYPGGVRESGMRDYHREPYTLQWQERTGYLRLALEADAEIVFVAAVGSDEAYYQSRLPTPGALVRTLNGGDDARYRGLRLRFGAAGPHLLPGLLPFPVRITHQVSEPLDLGDRRLALRDPEALEELHHRVWITCQRFLDAAVARRHHHGDLLDGGIRSLQRVLQQLGV